MQFFSNDQPNIGSSLGNGLAVEATSFYQNKWWPSLMVYLYAFLSLNEFYSHKLYTNKNNLPMFYTCLEIDILKIFETCQRSER